MHKPLDPLEFLRLVRPPSLPPGPFEFLGKPESQEEVVTTVSAPIDKPGCTAADESGVVLYHLQGLASGKQGFGVLATDVERLERAARGAERVGDHELAQSLRSFSLLEVRDAKAAAQAAERLQPLADRAWELGRRCGKAQSKAQAALGMIQRGELELEVGGGDDGKSKRMS